MPQAESAGEHNCLPGQASRSDDGRWNQQGSRSDECDMGFAMGIEGTQIAKDAAVLLNVNFTYIVVVAK